MKTSKMFAHIKSWIPNPIKGTIKKIYRKIRPPRIRVSKFTQPGCEFEVTTKMEGDRVRSFGNEAESITSVLAEIKPSDVFYDIGSCVGIYAIHAARMGASVIAFEPDPGYRKRLQRNIQINRFEKKVKVIDWAVSEDKGAANLYTDGVNGNSPSLRLVGDRGLVTVKTNSIDNAIKLGQLPWPDLIKMDIEGAEILALRGMVQTLSSEKSPRYLFIEFHPKFLPEFNSSVDECVHIIEACGYGQDQASHRSDELHFIFRK